MVTSEFLEPAKAALAVLSMAGVVVVSGTAVVLASSAEFMLPMARALDEDEVAQRLASEKLKLQR